MSKILIADASGEFCRILAQALPQTWEIYICHDGHDALNTVRNIRPDVLVLDLLLPGLDGITLLGKISEAGFRPLILAMTRLLSGYVAQSLEKVGVSYIMLKPCDAEAVASRIVDLTKQAEQSGAMKLDKRGIVSNLLLSLGMPTKLQGFACSREAILLLVENRDQSITKELYPDVAKLCGGNGSQVERKIRTAVEASWKLGDSKVWAEYFLPCGSGESSKPTNSAFLTRLADHVCDVIARNSGDGAKES